MKRMIALAMLLGSSALMAQYDYKDSNMVGITGGVNQLMLQAKGISVKNGNGWNAGLSIRGNFYNDWDAIYAMQFNEYNFSVASTNAIGVPQEVDYTMSGGQLTLQFSYKIVPRHFSIELGPAIHFQGKMEYDRSKAGNILTGTSLKAEELRDISKLNLSPVVGFTAGFLNLRLNVSYQYGVFNTFAKVNQDHDSHITGHPGVLNGNLVVYF